MRPSERMPRTRSELAACFEDARARLVGLVADLDDAQLAVPEHAELNPFLWEIGHVAWFQEFWTLRTLGGRAPICTDEFFDSSSVAHELRWRLDLGTREETLEGVRHVLDRVLERLEGVELDERELYFHRLALFHEDMHAEALTYMRQTLALPAPAFAPALDGAAGGEHPGDVEFAGGTLRLGAGPDADFAFDNERDAHEVECEPFRLARAPVTQREFRAFVEDGGYARPELWSDEGWLWRSTIAREHPRYWRRESPGEWSRRHFDRRIPLEDALPVSHVSWHEADAYCRWAQRRLPTEAEWELAARTCAHALTHDGATNTDFARAGCAPVDAHPEGDGTAGLRQMFGNLWEWTASPFAPYPGFEPGPYRDYSAPWFFTRMVLRGGAWATPRRTLRPSWRNFFEPERNDVLAGFRTAARE